MELHQVAIAKPSARSLAKLKRGEKVRLQKGTGMNLLVVPSKYNQITHSFSRGSGVHLALSPDELHHNHAEGIFGKRGDDALRWIGKKTGIGGDKFKDLAYQAGDMAKSHIKRIARKGIAAAGAAAATSNPELAPFVPYAVNKAADTADMFLDNPASFGVGGALAPHSRQIATQALNAYTGENNGKLTRASMGNYLANVAHAQLQAATGGTGLFAEPMGSGMFAQPAGGQGLYAQPMRARGLSRRRREMASVGIHGNLLSGHGLPPALIPQPYSANFQFAHTLPPAYQAIHHVGI
jgi:hypothetical protein